MATKARTRNIKWNTNPASLGRGRWAYVRSCKLSELSIGLFILERLDTNLLPTEVVGTFEGLDGALAAANLEPPATCQRCGRTVVPGCQIPDPGMPCPK
jgi:hypothetical protein